MARELKSEVMKKQTVKEFLNSNLKTDKEIDIHDINKYFYTVLAKNITCKQMLITVKTSSYVYKILQSHSHNFNLAILSIAINVIYDDHDKLKEFLAKQKLDTYAKKMVFKDLYFDLYVFLNAKGLDFIMPNIGGVLDYYYAHKA